MKTLELVRTNLTPVSLANFPNHLEELLITDSLVPHGWFSHMSKEGSFPKLKLLHLSQSSKTSDADLKDIIAKSSLTVLKLRGCYRVTEKGLQAVAESQKELDVLEISETQCTDLALHHIGRNLTKLKTLNISGCVKVTNAGVAVLAACLRDLESLDMNGCPLDTQTCLGNLKKLKKLKKYRIQGEFVHC